MESFVCSFRSRAAHGYSGRAFDSGSRAQRPARRSAPFQRGPARRKTYPRARWGPGRARRRRPSCVKCACARRGTIYIWLSARRGWRCFLSRDGAPETDAHPLSDAGTTWWTTRLATTSCHGPRGARSSRFTRRTSSPASCCRSTSSTETSARSCGNSTPTWVHSRFYPRTRVPERPGGRALASLDAHAPEFDS